jgi:hypothetical protein
MEKFFLFWFYVACMLAMVFVMASGVLGGFRNGWRYMRVLVSHITGMAVAGAVLMFVLLQFIPTPP